MFVKLSIKRSSLEKLLKSQHSSEYSDVLFSSITTSSLEAQSGSIFVPLIDKRDGHDFIVDAMTRGAAGFLCQQDHPQLKRLSPEMLKQAIFVPDTLRALGRVAEAHRLQFQLPVIAVTGSNGKTTTKDLIATIFQSAYKKKLHATEKNFNNEIGLPFSIFGLNKQHKIAVFEMGMNHAGEIARLSKMARPETGVITSVGHAHIEFFKSTAAIARAKGEILKGMKKGGALFVPKSILHLSILKTLAQKSGVKLQTVSLENAGLKIAKQDEQGYELLLGKEKFRFNFFGSKVLENLSLAVAVAKKYALTNQQIVSGIKKYKPAAGRFSVRRGYFTVIDDGYNANPDSTMASFDALKHIAGDKPLAIVLGDFKELGTFSKRLHEKVADAIAQEFSSNTAIFSYGDQAQLITERLRKQFNFPSAQNFVATDAGRQDLIGRLSKLKRGSVILIKGSRSMQMEKIAESLKLS